MGITTHIRALNNHHKINIVVSAVVFASYMIPEHAWIGLCANAIWIWGDDVIKHQDEEDPSSPPVLRE